VGLTHSRDSFKMRRELNNRFARSCESPPTPRHTERRALPTHFVSKAVLKAIISPDAIATAGTYIVMLKCEGEAFPESHRAHLVVGFKPERVSSSRTRG